MVAIMVTVVSDSVCFFLTIMDLSFGFYFHQVFSFLGKESSMEKKVFGTLFYAS
jgi:hypothetical protein